MNYKKTIAVTIVISMISFFSVSNVYAQTISFGISNATGSSPIFGFSNSTSVSTPTSCIKQVNEQMHSQRSMISLTKARSIAENNPEFKSNVSEYNSKYYQTFGIWSWDSNCNITLKGVKVFYSASNATSLGHYVVITINPQLDSVINVTTQIPVFHTTSPSSNWSGYEMQASASSSNPNTPVYEAYAQWYEPSISIPPYSSCSFTHCDISIWPGLVSNPGGIFVNGTNGGAIVQAGSESGIDCSPFCISYYYLWTEFYFKNGNNHDSGATNCLNVNAGDQVYSDVIDEAEFGGNVNLYDVYIGDITQSTACTSIVAKNFNMGTPMYAEFIGETPTFGSTQATLPQFTSFTVTGYLDDPINGYYSMSNSYNLNLYNSYTLTNAGGVGGNINFGRASSGSFTSTWSPNCVVPSGSWTISSSCTVTQSSAVNGNVLVQSGANLYVPYGVQLNVGLTQHNIKVKNGGTLWVKYGGQVK